MFSFNFIIAAVLVVYLPQKLSFLLQLRKKSPPQYGRLNYFLIKTPQVQRFDLNAQIDNGVDNEFYTLKSDNQIKEETKKEQEMEVKQNIEGFLNNDLLSMESGKQVRVTLYIVLAILPCLLLIPFMMDRSFVPDIDPTDMMRK